jgi:hypothetical protein
VGGVEKSFQFIPPSSTTADRPGFVTIPDSNEAEISVLISTHMVEAFAVGIDIFCELTAQGMARWQYSAWDAIMNAYENRLALYEDRMRARQAQAEGTIGGAPPLTNRRLERDELRKLCILMLRGGAAFDFDAYMDPELAEPTLEVDEACREGSIIRFLENAIEWSNMMYVFYPYFWGRHSGWVRAVNTSDPDPDFEAFLKAGAARVQVPVRPGFEKAMAYFCQYGEPWLGGEPPLRDDPLYVPIVDEIAESLGRGEDGVPYPADAEPWEVVLPTTLVVLQDLQEVPGIRDALTDTTVALLPR